METGSRSWLPSTNKPSILKEGTQYAVEKKFKKVVFKMDAEAVYRSIANEEGGQRQNEPLIRSI